MDELNRNGIISTKDLAFIKNATTHEIFDTSASSPQRNVPTLSFILATDVAHIFL